MVTISPGTGESIMPALESAGRMENGTEVRCSIVMSGVPDAETFAIIVGYGAMASHYYQLQRSLAELGWNSVCPEPLYRLSNHQNRLQAYSAEVAIKFMENEYETEVRNGYGHSWGGAKLASLIHHGLPALRLAVFHNTSGLESPIGNWLAHPVDAIRNVRKETSKIGRCVTALDNVLTLNPKRGIGSVPSMVQQGVVASQHRKLAAHLETVKGKDIKLVGLWPGTDPLFRSKGHPIFDHNEVLEDSVHTEPQCNPSRVARKLVELATAA